MKRQKLRLHVNRKIAPRAPARPASARPAVVEMADPPAGMREIKARDSEGNRIGYCQFTASEVDEQLIEDLVAWQARRAGPTNSPLRIA